MPFVDAAHRLNPDHGIAGDRCYLWYRWLMSEWRDNPCWTTADRLYYHVRKEDESLKEQIAKELAWQVFFQYYVMPYEDKKRKLNGDI